MIRLIAAIDMKNGLAKGGVQPWYLPSDEVHFTKMTKMYGGYVLTGSTTFRGSYRGKPLAGRQNYILTHDRTPIEGVTVVNDLNDFLAKWADKDLWVAGGAKVFESFFAINMADELYITHIDANFGCDQFFPDIVGYEVQSQSEDHSQNGFHFHYSVYVRSK